MELTDNVLARGELTRFERPTQFDKNPNAPDYFEGGWEEIWTRHNLIVNHGWETFANTLTNTGSYINTHYTYFAWGDGTTNPAITDTAAIFYADCATSDTKAVTSIDAFDIGALTQQWNCFLSSGDNTVTSITKFTLMNANPGTVMFNEVKFAPITKNAAVEEYFRYRLYFSQI